MFRFTWNSKWLLRSSLWQHAGHMWNQGSMSSLTHVYMHILILCVHNYDVAWSKHVFTLFYTGVGGCHANKLGAANRYVVTHTVMWTAMNVSAKSVIID